MEEMESSSNEKTTSTKNSVLSRYDEVFHAQTSDIKLVSEKITADCKKFIQHYEDSCLQMEARSKLLEQREHELRKKERKILKEKKKLELKKTVRERLSSCKQLLNKCYSSRKVAEGLKREVDLLHKRRAELEEQLKAKSFESLESEIMELETALQVIEDEDRIDLQEKVKNLQKELIEKGEQLEELKKWSKSLGVTIDGKNEELQDARQELIHGLKMYPCTAYIHIKTMGELDMMRFCSKKAKQNATKNAMNFWLECKQLVNDQNWHPFTVGLDEKEIVNEGDEKMVRLKAECSEEQYLAVVTALKERNQYNKTDCMQELWNFHEQRKASLREGIDYILNRMEDS